MSAPFQVEVDVDSLRSQAERWQDKAASARREAARCEAEANRFARYAQQAESNGGSLTMTSRLR